MVERTIRRKGTAFFLNANTSTRHGTARITTGQLSPNQQTSLVTDFSIADFCQFEHQINTAKLATAKQTIAIFSLFVDRRFLAIQEAAIKANQNDKPMSHALR